jgi:5-methyltetrahydrofolate--homocysteine methyltransferase
VRVSHETVAQMMLLLQTEVKKQSQANLKVTTMVGGSPVTQQYADSIGADGYAEDAISAVDKAKEMLR